MNYTPVYCATKHAVIGYTRSWAVSTMTSFLLTSMSKARLYENNLGSYQSHSLMHQRTGDFFKRFLIILLVSNDFLKIIFMSVKTSKNI